VVEQSVKDKSSNNHSLYVLLSGSSNRIVSAHILFCY